MLTFGSSGGVWEGMYIPLGLPVVDMEFDPVTVMVIGWLMHSVAGSNANLHCFEKMSWYCWKFWATIVQPFNLNLKVQFA